MPKEVLVYRGWIGGRESDRAELRQLGVGVGSWNPVGAFDYCSMTAGVFVRFCQAWRGRYVWGLIGKRELVLTPKEISDDENIPF
jgi:hypothetical protein